MCHLSEPIFARYVFFIETNLMLPHVALEEREEARSGFSFTLKSFVNLQ